MRERLTAVILALVLAIASAMPALAVNPDEILDDPALEQRARDLSAGLRCMVCQNQSIDDSDAPLARDLRLLVRERLKAGDTDEQVLGYIVSRYGEFVLLRPYFGLHTAVLWAMPVVVLAIGAILAWVMMRRRAAAAPAALTPEEEARITKILDEGE